VKDINRGALRVTEAARAQHETAVAQAVSKILLRDGCEAGDIATAENNIRALGVFIVTGIYVKGVLHSHVKTWANLSSASDIKTEWIQEGDCQGLAKQILDN